ncbi:hypothetical protein P3L10_028698 [Capsicum annuum]
MDQRLPVDAITIETTDWTCKVQVVDKFRPRKSSDSSEHFQTILVQDESEQQVSIILYGDDIPKYENLFGFFETYLVSYTIVEAVTNNNELEAYTIVEAVTNNNELEAPLPAPKKLDTLSFSAIEQQCLGVEFDQSKKPILFTIWGDLADNEGAELLYDLHEYPIILARRIGVTEFRGALRLETRYQSTISTNPQYVQATTLKLHNERMLLSSTLRSSSSSSLNLAPIEDQVLAISTIPELLLRYKVSPWKRDYCSLTVLNHFTCLRARIAVSLCAPKLKRWFDASTVS